MISDAAFVENMHAFVKVKTKALAGLSGVLRVCCDFGIDFETAHGMRRHLQKLFGFERAPSLNDFTVLCSDLMLVALSNVAVHSPRHMRELEQWLDFLIDFHYQESAGGSTVAPLLADYLRTPPELRQLAARSKSNVMSYASSVITRSNSEPSDDEERAFHLSNTKDDAVETEENIDSQEDECDVCHVVETNHVSHGADVKAEHFETGEPFEPTKRENASADLKLDENGSIESEAAKVLDKEEVQSCRSSKSDSMEDVADGNLNDEDKLVGKQIAAALENYRRSKKMQAKKHFSLPSSPKLERV